jgi:hypothetical protein
MCAVCLWLQVVERKEELAKLETMDNGKPIEEAEWDMVSLHAVPGRPCTLSACSPI